MAHFQMSTGGSKSNEHVDHFLVDIHTFTIRHTPSKRSTTSMLVEKSLL